MIILGFGEVRNINTVEKGKSPPAVDRPQVASIIGSQRLESAFNK
jgi:hypothetical protein